jgi:hypothetical protein
VKFQNLFHIGSKYGVRTQVIVELFYDDEDFEVEDVTSMFCKM